MNYTVKTEFISDAKVYTFFVDKQTVAEIFALGKTKMVKMLKSGYTISLGNRPKLFKNERD